MLYTSKYNYCQFIIALFQIMSRGKNSIDQETMLLFLETLIQASLNVIVSFT